jgi:hypothetical protein
MMKRSMSGRMKDHRCNSATQNSIKSQIGALGARRNNQCLVFPARQNLLKAEPKATENPSSRYKKQKKRDDIRLFTELQWTGRKRLI